MICNVKRLNDRKYIKVLQEFYDVGTFGSFTSQTGQTQTVTIHSDAIEVTDYLDDGRHKHHIYYVDGSYEEVITDD